MTPSKDQEIIQLVAQAEGLYHRLVLVVGPSGSGKTAVLKALAASKGWKLVQLNLELARGLLELTERQRPLRVQKLLEGIVAQADGAVVLLDNTELLFDAALMLDPLRLLQGVARSRCVVASWNGIITEESLTYASPEHPEFRQYPARELLLVTMTGVETTQL